MSEITAANVADACVRLAVEFRVLPVKPLFPARVTGRVLPATHYGSVDVFFEALDAAQPGDVLVIDNGNRQDEGCIGDLTALEAKAFGVSAIVVWGLHRDSAELIRIGLPVWSTGTNPAGPRSVRPRAARPSSPAEYVIADEDGVIIFPLEARDSVMRSAQSIYETERIQADRVRSGLTLHKQLEWDRYVAARRTRAEYTFREHLKTLGAAIEV